MKKLLSIIAFVIFAGSLFVGSAEARVTRVNGYTRSNGTYVAPYYRTSPNSTRFDNYSTRGNYNPYTGKKGYVSPYKYR